MGVTSIGNRLIADEGDLYREFQKLRKERALFQLSLEGPNGLVLSTQPDKYIVVAAYQDNGYSNEPIRANVIEMDNSGVHTAVPFDGGTPAELIDTMIEAYNRWSALQNVHNHA